MDAFQITNALSASFFALLGIWAAVAERHWFLRFAVVSFFLLVALLIPAYEVVIEFAISIGLIAAVVWLVRDQRKWPPRLSLKTALLFTVVVAVTASVAGNVPGLNFYTWINLVGVGITTASISLLCLWAVFGKAHWWKRVLLGLLGATLSVGMCYVGEMVTYSIARGSWDRALQQYCDLSNLGVFLSRFVPTTVLGVAIVCTVLLLARSSGWFTEKSTGEKPRGTRRMLASRIALTTIMLSVVAPLVYILYRLLTPTPYPVVEITQPNAFDDYVAAAKIVEGDLGQLRIDLLSTAELKQERDKLKLPLQRIDQGLNRSVFQIPRYDKAEPEEAGRVHKIIYTALQSLFVRMDYARRTGSTSERTDAALAVLQFGTSLSAEAGFDWWMPTGAETAASEELTRIVGLLDAEDCHRVIDTMIKCDERRPSLDQRARYQHLIDENSSWSEHLSLLLQEWSGRDPYRWGRLGYGDTIAHTRVLIAQLALQSFFLEQDRLPDSLSELVPEYLPAIPDDPFVTGPSGAGPLKYRRIPIGFIVYSVGPNGQDDGGRVQIASTGELSKSKDDICAVGPVRPHLWENLLEFGEGVLNRWLK